MKINPRVEFDTDDLVDQLVCFPSSEILEFVKEIDKQMQDWGFTFELAKYLVAELKKSAPTEEPFVLSELEK